MQRYTYAALLAALAASLAGPSAAQGQRIPSPYRFVEAKQDLGIAVSYMFAARGTAGLGPAPGPAISVEYTRRVSRPLSITPTLVYFPTDRDVIDPSLEDGEGSITVGTESLDLLLVAGRVNLNLTGTRTWHKLIPYLTGGLGIAFELGGIPACFEASTRPDCQIRDRERFDFGTSFLMQLGVGTAWLATRQLGFRLEFVNTIWRLDTPPGYYDPVVTIDPVPPSSDWTNNFQLGLTLSYWF